jgi:serine/threonine protein kinase
MAPEVFANEPYNEKADVFSFGVCMYELTARCLVAFTELPQDSSDPEVADRCGSYQSPVTSYQSPVTSHQLPRWLQQSVWLPPSACQHCIILPMSGPINAISSSCPPTYQNIHTDTPHALPRGIGRSDRSAWRWRSGRSLRPAGHMSQQTGRPWRRSCSSWSAC